MPTWALKTFANACPPAWSLKQSRHLENITSQEARRTYHRSGLV